MRRTAKPSHDVRDPAFKRTYDRTLRRRRFRWDRRDHRVAYRFAEALLLDVIIARDPDGRHLLKVTLTVPAAMSLEDARAALDAFTVPANDDEGSWFVEEVGERGGHHWHGIELVRENLAARAERWSALTAASEVEVELIRGSAGSWDRANTKLVSGIASWTRYSTKSPRRAAWKPIRYRTRVAGVLEPLWAAAVADDASPPVDLSSRVTGGSIASKASTCEVCGTALVGGRSDRVTCTHSCRTKAWRMRRRAEEERRDMERLRRAEQDQRDHEQRERRRLEVDARRRQRAHDDARLAALAWTLDDVRVARASGVAERARLLALADLLADAEPPCAIDHVPLETDPLIGRWLVALSRDEVDSFRERAAIIEEGARVTREQAEWLAFSELESRFAMKRAA